MSSCLRLSAYLLVFLFALPLGSMSQSIRAKGSAIFRARINASFSVDAKGAAIYTIPLDLPPGTAGAAPALSIVYSSQSGNGLLGMGFSLAGLSAIQRTGASNAEDGFTCGVNYDSSDRFAVDGNRLMRIDPNAPGYCTPGAIYMTELQTWCSFQAQGSTGQGPASFTALRKDGSIDIYGDSVGAAVPSRGHVFGSGPLAGSIRTWLLSSVTDPHGNTIRYMYSYAPAGLDGQPLQGSGNNSTAYPDAIYYSSNKYSQAPEKRKVQFYYEPRTDTLLRYAGGAAVAVFLRLKAIQSFIIKEDTVPVFKYLIAYDSVSPLGVSRLSSLSLAGTSGDSAAPLRFGWSNGGKSLVPAGNTWTGPGSPQDGKVADCNRDGKTDIIPVQSNAIKTVYLSTGNGFLEQPLVAPIAVTPNSYLGDYNGDGLPDMLVADGLSGSIYYGNGSGFENNQVAVKVLVNMDCSHCTWVADYNGDGRADVLTVLGTGGFLFFGDTVGLQPQIVTGNLSLTTGQTWVADFNGDGQSDLYSYGGIGEGSLYLSDFSRSGNWRPVITILQMNIASLPSNNLVADFNADGLADILTVIGSQYNLYLSTGQGFDTARAINTVNLSIGQNWLSDFNGDGCMDFYILTGDSAIIYYYYGTQCTAEKTASPALLSNWTWSGDFNGDGIADLYAANTTTMYFGGGTKGLFISPSNQVPHLLKHINNGIQGTTDIHYRPMSDTLIYQPATSAPGGMLESLSTQNNFSSFPLSPVQVPLYPFVQAQNSLYLLADYHVSDGMKNRYAYQYRYSGSLNDLDGYGWLGFATMSQRDSLADNIFTNQYGQLFPLTGQVLTTLKTDLNAVPLRRQRINYLITENNGYGGSPVYQVNTSQTRNDYYENGQFVFTTGVNNLFDAYGNLIWSANLNDTTEPAHTIFTNSSFINDTLGWHIGFRQSGRQSSDSSGLLVLNQDSIIYDPLNYDVLQEKRWLNTDSSWLVQHNHYDLYGNRNWKVNESGDTTWIYYDSVYNSFETMIVSPPNNQGKRLVAYTQIDPAFGKMTQARDVNGNLFTVELDQFGQDSLRTGPAPDSGQVVLSQLLYSAPDSAGYRLQTMTRVDWAGHKWDTAISIYDGLNREVSRQWYGTKHQLITTIRQYNSNNLEVRSSLPAYKNGKVQWVIRTYDANQRLQTLQYPAGEQQLITNQYTYSGKQVTLQEAVGTPVAANSIRVMDYFNGTSRMVSYTDPNGLTIAYDYDLLGRMTNITDPGNLVSTIAYNSLNDVTSRFNPAAGNTTLLYNYIGRTNTLIRQSGDSLLSVYDALNRKAQWINRSTTYTYMYDLPGYANGNNNLCTVGVGDSSWYYTYGYDAYGRQEMTNLHINGRYHQQYAWYNADGSLGRKMQPDSTLEQYDYYTNGFLKSITQQPAKSKKPQRPAVQFLDFDAAGNITFTRYGNGLQRRASFFPFGLVKDYSIAAPSGMVLASQAYHWDARNELRRVKDRLKPGNNQSFHFQPNGRLDTARGPYGLMTYAYDPSGNLLQKDSVEYVSLNYQVMTGTRNGRKLFANTWDRNGNLAGRTTYSEKDSTNAQYVFDSWNRLMAIVSGTDTLYRFTYNAEGQRLIKTDVRKGITTCYISPGYEVTRTPSASLRTSYVMTQSQRLVSSTQVTDSVRGRHRLANGIPVAGTQYYHQDFINSNRLATNGAGKARYTALYKPFGEAYAVKGPDKPRYKFGGQELDESGLYYFNARYYDPVTGRFISADDRPGGSPDRHDIYNRYAYTLNNPVQYTDPSGHVISDLLINVLMTIAEVATEGGAVAGEELLDAAAEEVGPDFLEGWKMSRPRLMSEEDRSTLRNVYKIRRERLASLSSQNRCLNGESRNALEVPFFNNNRYENLKDELLKAKVLQDKPYSGIVRYHQEEDIINALRTGERYKFTLSTKDFTLRIGSLQITHAVVEGEGNPVYTAGIVQFEDGKLILTNHSGHYWPTVPSMRMSAPFWNMMKGQMLNFSSIIYRPAL